MQRYPVRASHRVNLGTEALVRLATEHFGRAEPEGDGAKTAYGAIASLVVRGDRRELVVDVTMNPQVDEAVARETIGRYNRFLESTTGYTAKERARRLRKSAGGPASGA